MNLSLETSIPAITVFLQGLLSFFSPCVLPLIPLYAGYLSGGAKTVQEDGSIHYKRKTVLINTLFFVLGISFTFFLLGLGFTTAGRFFHSYQTLFTRIGGIIIILFGVAQLGIFGQSSGREHRLAFRPDVLAMNPFTALVLGFTFSFAWTPCVGPALASVLIMAASSASSGTGFLLIGIYTAGFVIPFLAVGLFTGALLEFFKKYRSLVKYTVRIGGILMILIGIMMFTGWMNHISSYLSGIGGSSSGQTSDAGIGTDSETASSKETASEKAAARETAADTESKVFPAPDFTLTDQFGNTHTFSDYKGKTIFLNFWATWCPPCKAEMPEIQELFEQYGENSGDVIILGVASPEVGGEGTADEIASFLEENSYTYPVVMDTDGTLAYTYGISAYPTTFMIDADGNIYGYVSGQLSKEMMENIISQTLTGASS